MINPDALEFQLTQESPISQEEAYEIRELTRRMRPSDPIRRAAETILAGVPLSDELMVRLTQHLARPSLIGWKHRVVAAWALGRARLPVGLEDVAAQWLHHVIQNGHSLDMGHRILRAWLRVSPLTLLLMIGMGSTVMPAVAAVIVGLVVSIPITLGFYPLSAAIDREKTNRVRTAAVTALGRLSLPGSTGLAARSVRDTNKKVRTQAIQAFISISHSLHAGHYPELGRDATPNLLRLLSHPDYYVVLAALHALGCGSGGNAVEMVEKCANRGRTEAIRAAAINILPVLLERQRKENESKTLLRASDVADSPEQTLLRAAQGNTESDPAVLLRSSSSGSNP